MCPSVPTIEGEKSPRIKGFEYADGTVGPVGTSGAGTRSWVKAICDLAEGMVPELISVLGILGSGGNRNRAGDVARGNRPAAGHDQQRPAERLSGLALLWQLGREPINPEAWANVRFGAHSGLKSEIAQGPKSVWTAPAVQEESDVSAKRSGAAMYPAFKCSHFGRWP
jgi:hypothetical protein